MREVISCRSLNSMILMGQIWKIGLIGVNNTLNWSIFPKKRRWWWHNSPSRENHFSNISVQIGKKSSSVNKTQVEIFLYLTTREHKGISQPSVIRRHLSREEINERRNKGKCFRCNEPYSRRHRCLRRQLYSIILEYVVREHKRETKLAIMEKRKIIHPKYLWDSKLVQAMRLTEKYKKRLIHSLVDSDNTHNVLDMNMTKNMGLNCILYSCVVVKWG